MFIKSHRIKFSNWFKTVTLQNLLNKMPMSFRQSEKTDSIEINWTLQNNSIRTIWSCWRKLLKNLDPFAMPVKVFVGWSGTSLMRECKWNPFTLIRKPTRQQSTPANSLSTNCEFVMVVSVKKTFRWSWTFRTSPKSPLLSW
jgi:hypothetical protein